MKTSNLYTVLGLMLVAEQSAASVPVGTQVGQAMVQAVGSVVPVAMGVNMPVGFGGVVGIALVSLIIGTQLIKRKK